MAGAVGSQCSRASRPTLSRLQSVQSDVLPVEVHDSWSMSHAVVTDCYSEPACYVALGFSGLWPAGCGLKAVSALCPLCGAVRCCRVAVLRAGCGAARSQAGELSRAYGAPVGSARLGSAPGPGCVDRISRAEQFERANPIRAVPELSQGLDRGPAITGTEVSHVLAVPWPCR